MNNVDDEKGKGETLTVSSTSSSETTNENILVKLVMPASKTLFQIR